MVAKAAAAANLLYQHQLCVSQSDVTMEIEPPSPPAASVLSKSPTATATIIHAASESAAIALGISRSESAVTTIQTTRSSKYLPSIRSGSHTDIGPRSANEDEHVRIDDLSALLDTLYQWSLPSSFYAVFDGHGGSNAASYVKNNALRFFFEDADLPQTSDIDEIFLKELESSCRRSFLLADEALAGECSVDASCGTTAITALIIGRHLLIANAGDCRAVLCRKGKAVQMSQDHKPSHPPERKRIEDLGGFVDEYGYLNAELAVTRALGDWYMKLPDGSASPLTAEPEVKHILLTEDDEFLIIGCDGIWDVMSNQDAVSLVRCELRLHNDPQRCARALVNQALRRDTGDNLTAIVVCFTSPRDSVPAQRPRLRCLSLSEEARRTLQSLFQ